MASQPEAELKHWSPKAVWKGLHKPVFIPAVLIIVGALIFATWFGRVHGAEAFEDLNTAITNGVGWWYILICTGFVVFALWAGLSRAGSIRLGRDDEKPEFSLVSWFTMLFSAGMGIGLVFWGVAEPLNHLVNPPETSGEVGVDASGETVLATESELASSAIGQTLFHWGLHAWAIYVVVGLGLAYMTFRRGRPLSMRWLLEPVFGRRLIESWVGHVIDVIAIVGTMFGVVTSLGLGVQQIVAGLGFMGWTEGGSTVLIWLVIFITAIAIFSVVSGVHKGLKWLSNINMMLAAILAIFVLLAGPTLFLVQSLISNTGEYAMAFPQLMFETDALYAGGDTSWSADWTIYYWGWWMSWAPFVGMFIARISRGRTIREFVFGVLLAPTVVGIIWFSIFGSSGIYYQIRDGIMVDEDGGVSTDGSLFMLLEQLPLTSIMAVLSIVVITIFFITSSDSASLVIDILANGGRAETPRLTRVFWALLEGLAAIVLLTAAGEAADAALRVLQVSSIAAAAPLSIVLVLAVLAMIRMLQYESRTMPRYVRIRPQASKAALVGAAREAAGTAEAPAVQRSLREILASQGQALRGVLGGTSATFVGLPPRTEDSAQPSGSFTGDKLVFAVQDVPASATSVDAATGTIGLDEDAAYQDPISGEVFETPEFAESNSGWNYQSEQFFTETVTGTVPVVDPQKNDDAGT
ncbi:BCCT family transporter [Nesterenkonia muleiensis]|uniref:BCCT family transporter n=1 Tax=Nesterenkonia muleiensis TaxID=2282648 RepID=UPI000E734B5B|nr:BCCT family transporter [Nesterenkonia muleiensis]